MTTTTTLSELTGDYVLDVAQTRIGFVARHTMGTKVRGQFDEFESHVHLDGDDPSRSSARVTIQATSIQTGNQKRDDQLRSSFLKVGDYPTITFTSTEVEQVDESHWQLTGDLTIRGVSKPVTVQVTLTGSERDVRSARLAFVGSVTISRHDWGVNWNAATAVLVGKQVTLELDVAAVRAS